MNPLVSVITPTWERHDWLFSRCIPSVRAQAYPHVEHVVVSDGPDDELRARAGDLASDRLRFEFLPEHDPASRWGHWARLHGIETAKGDLITYLDDDDAFRPDHAELLVRALQDNPSAGFAYSQMMWQPHGTVITSNPPAYGGIGTPMIMHRREILQAATWEQSLPSIDYDLVARWIEAGVQYAAVDSVTIDVWPSAFR